MALITLVYSNKPYCNDCLSNDAEQTAQTSQNIKRTCRVVRGCGFIGSCSWEGLGSFPTDATDQIRLGGVGVQVSTSRSIHIIDMSGNIGL